MEEIIRDSLALLTFYQFTGDVLRTQHDRQVDRGEQQECQLCDVFSSTEDFHLARYED